MTPLSLIDELALDLGKLSKTLTAIVEQAKVTPAQDTVAKTQETIQQPAQKAEENAEASGDTSSAKDKEPAIAIEQIRAVLAEKSQAGLTGKVKSLLESFGANKLSSVKPEDYEKLLAKAQELK